MNKKTVLTKSILSVAGVLLLAFSVKLFFNTTSNLKPKVQEINTKNMVLLFVSSSYDFLKGANNINPNIVISIDDQILINGINITYSVEGLQVPTVIPPDIIKINDKLIDPQNCSTSINESNNNLLFTCYTPPTKLVSNDVIAYVDLDVIDKLALKKKVKVKIKDSNSYITINSIDQAITLKTNEFVINIIDMPKDCLNIPSADINCDGKINSYDVMLFEKPNSDIEPYIKYRLDLNKDKIIDSKDKKMFNVALSVINNK